MANVELKPARVFEQFAKINAIPRPSKHEEKMIEYLKAFGQERGLETKVDETGNVIIRKPATPGMENKPCVILQSHMDIVCDKLVDVEIDNKIAKIKQMFDKIPSPATPSANTPDSHVDEFADVRKDPINNFYDE